MGLHSDRVQKLPNLNEGSDLPTISVINPAYNAGQFLLEAVGSALAQAYLPSQTIVIDDGSTDDPRHTLGPPMDRIAYIAQPNRGVSAARNAGSRCALGDYVAYLDADELWLPNTLAVIARCIAADGRPGIVIDDFHRIDKEGRLLSRNMDLNAYCRTHGSVAKHGETPVRHLSAQDFLTLIVRGYPVYPSALAIRSDVLAAVGFWNESIPRSEDFELGLRLATSTDLLLVDEPLTIVRRHEAHGREADYFLAATQADFSVLRMHLDRLSADRTVAQVLGRRLLGIGSTLRRHSRAEEAQDACRVALRLTGNRVRALGALTKSMFRAPGSRSS